MLLPRPLRKFIAIFRGEVSPLLILLSVLLGFWFGLVPGWYGLHVVLLVLVLVLNVHVGVFLLFAGLGRALCYAAAPLMYYTGVWALDNLGGVFETLGALPVLGLTDYARYAVAGGMVIGPVVGIVAGLLLARSVQTFRKTWLKLEEGSDAFRKWHNSGWVRMLDRVLVGKRAKDVSAVLKRRARVVRLPGVLAAVVVIIAGVIGLQYLQRGALRDFAADALTHANGAEVDLASLELKPFSGRVSAGGIAVTDPRQPTHNRLAIDELTADANVYDLLRGRVVVDEVTVGGVALDQPRETPGRVLTPPEDDEEFDAAKFSLPELAGDVAQLESYMRNAQRVREWLRKVSDWLPEGEEKEAEEAKPEVPEEYLAFLRARAPQPPAPHFVVRLMKLDDVNIPADYIGRSNMTCENVSDAPVAAGLPVTIALASTEYATELQIVCHYEDAGGGAEVSGSLENIDLRELQASLDPGNPVVFEGGTASAKISGRATRDMIDLAIDVKTQNMRARTTGGTFFDLDPRVADETMKVLENIETRLRLVGPITQPRLVFDVGALKDTFRDALVRAGKNELARQLSDVAGVDLSGTINDPGSALKDPVGTAGNVLEGVLGKRDQKKKEEATSKPAKDDDDDPLSKLRRRVKKP